MNNQQTKESEALAGRLRKGPGSMRLPMVSFVPGIIVIAIAIIYATVFSGTSYARSSTPSEIAAQGKFQAKWNSAQEESAQEMDSTFRVEEQKMDSILKAAGQGMGNSGK